MIKINTLTLNKYRSMWIMVFFDLPTDTKAERKVAQKFRERLLKDGFKMFQFSIYTRYCSSKENLAVHTKRVKNSLPKRGKISIIRITDKQFGMMENFYGMQQKKVNSIESTQLTLF